jgi:muconate cycloisomerase
MPRVTELELFAVDLPFKVTVRHAAAARTTSESLFLRARLDDGTEGWGECLPRVYVSGEGRDQAFVLLRETILPALVGRSFRSLGDAVSFLEKCDGKAPPEWVRPETPQTSAWCSVDLALLDAFGRAAGEPARPDPAAGPAPPDAALRRYRYSGVVSADHGWRYAVSLLKMRTFRFPHVKLKLEHDGTCRPPAPPGGCSAAGSTSGSTPTWPGTSSRRWRSSASSRRSGSARSSSRSQAATWPAWLGWWPSRRVRSWSTRV